MASFGEELRRHRELRAISLREIADATKINIRFLESLECNDFKHLPGGQFNKGFIRAYARHIGVDGEGMVDAYLIEVRRQEEAEKVLGRTSAPRGRNPATRRVVFMVLALVLAVGAIAGAMLGYWLLRRGKSAPGRTATSASATLEADGGGRRPEGSGSTTEDGTAGGSQPKGADTATSLSLLVLPLARTHADIACNGAKLFSGDLEIGRPFKLLCSGVFEVSMTDAGAANLSVNGERIYLGSAGQAVAGRHISGANFTDFTQPPADGKAR